jgi:hypothetical protein
LKKRGQATLFIFLPGLCSWLDLDQTARGLKEILIATAGAITATVAALLKICIAA